MSISRPSEANRLGVLFVCEDNARLSLIAEALMRERCAPWVRGFSAGINPADTADLMSLTTIMLAGLDNSGLWPKSWEGFSTTRVPIINVIVTLDHFSTVALPRSFPGHPEYRIWSAVNDNQSHIQSHTDVWREIQWLRPKVDALIDDLAVMRDLSLSRQPLAAE